MGDLIDFVAYKTRKLMKRQSFGSYEMWITQRFLAAGAGNGVTSRYDLAVEQQQEEDYYLFRYFFPDFDW